MDRKTEKLIALVRKHPGLDGESLKEKGWRPGVHGSLREAERAGLVEYRNGGWYVKE